MNRAEILAMKPGRELDALVAQWVMDGVTRAKINGQTLYYDLPYFSTDIAAAWKIFPKMREGLFSQRNRFMQMLQIVVSRKVAPDEADLIAWPDILWHVEPDDICIAALLAVEVK